MGRTIRHILIFVILKLPVEKECFVWGWPPRSPTLFHFRDDGPCFT